MLKPIVEERPDYVEPATPAREAIAEIWREVLKQDRIGQNDSFLALGGDSILATRVVARIRERSTWKFHCLASSMRKALRILRG